MIFRIIAYGDPVLKKVCEEVPENYKNLQELIDNMYETMYNANGVGLAAPQIGELLRLFIIDSGALDEEREDLEPIKKVFINPIILKRKGKDFAYNEGCLSIPDVREDIIRPPAILVEYYDEKGELIEEAFDGVNARIIQHECDHLDGRLFTDYITPLQKQMLKKQLRDISKGWVKVDYPMRFPVSKRKRA